jgi:uncharacterized protein
MAALKRKRERENRMIVISPHSEGCTFAIRAQPQAKKNAITGERDGALKIAVTAPPEDGKANAAIFEVLRKWLKIKRSQVEILQGQTSRDKVVLIRGLSPDELRPTIELCLNPSSA